MTSNCDRGFPTKEKALDAFDFLGVVFMNAGQFFGDNDGSVGDEFPEFYTLPPEFIKEHHNTSSGWQKVRIKKLQQEFEPFK